MSHVAKIEVKDQDTHRLICTAVVRILHKVTGSRGRQGVSSFVFVHVTLQIDLSLNAQTPSHRTTTHKAYRARAITVKEMYFEDTLKFQASTLGAFHERITVVPL